MNRLVRSRFLMVPALALLILSGMGARLARGTGEKPLERTSDGGFMPVAREPLTDCWVRLYEKPNYEGPALFLAGPATLRFARSAPTASVQSLEVGPGARLTLMTADGAPSRFLAVLPGDHSPYVRARMGGADPRAVMLECEL